MTKPYEKLRKELRRRAWREAKIEEIAYSKNWEDRLCSFLDREAGRKETQDNE